MPLVTQNAATEFHPPMSPTPDVAWDEVMRRWDAERVGVGPEAGGNVMPEVPASKRSSGNIVSDPTGLTTARLGAMNDVMTERVGMLNDLRSMRTQRNAPQPILEFGPWVQANDPEFAAQKYVMPQQLLMRAAMHDKYVQQQVALANMQRQRSNSPGAKRLVEDRLVEALMQQHGGDPEKVMKALRQIETATNKGASLTPENKLTQDAINQLLAENDDPLTALAKLHAIKRGSGGGSKADPSIVSNERIGERVFAPATETGQPSFLERMDADPLNGWIELADYYEEMSPMMSKGQRGKLQELLQQRAPSVAELTTAYKNGALSEDKAPEGRGALEAFTNLFAGQGQPAARGVPQNNGAAAAKYLRLRRLIEGTLQRDPDQ